MAKLQTKFTYLLQEITQFTVSVQKPRVEHFVKQKYLSLKH